ncbi:MAG: HlyD family secretion protein, partial [Alphaproteobacteria bacterium]
MFGKVKWLAAIVVVLALGAVIFFGSSSGSDADGFAFRTAKIERGIVATTVSASGNLKAVITVEVGAQVTGMVKELMADFNTPVKANQVIARIDPSIYEARVAEATGDVATARASVNMQKSALVGLLADIRASEAALEEARRDIERQRELLKTNVTSRSQVDKSQSGFDQAKARLDSIRAKVPQQQAQIEMAHAQMVQREAILQQRKLDLSYTFIRSPVDGVVINRSVDVGQTVAASLQTPVLFTIAQ